MEVHLTPEQEARLADIATKAGSDPEQLVKDVVLRLLEAPCNAGVNAPALPLWRLGARGELRRRDIYNDVG